MGQRILDLKARIRIVRRLDVEAARPMYLALGLPHPRSDHTGQLVHKDEVVLAALHKARLRVGSKQEAKESRAWLSVHGYTDKIG